MFKYLYIPLNWAARGDGGGKGCVTQVEGRNPGGVLRTSGTCVPLLGGRDQLGADLDDKRKEVIVHEQVI